MSEPLPSPEAAEALSILLKAITELADRRREDIPYESDEQLRARLSETVLPETEHALALDVLLKECVKANRDTFYRARLKEALMERRTLPITFAIRDIFGDE